MQQIADWLEKLNLGQYAQRFAENDIDFSVLRHLTDADLEKIVVSLGHRRKILAAITELPGASPSKHEPTEGVEPKPRETAERRQVTVMFSDLVGSTALSARMDPEDLREFISAYQKCVAETVQHFGGFVAKYMGDGVADESKAYVPFATLPRIATAPTSTKRSSFGPAGCSSRKTRDWPGARAVRRLGFSDRAA
jgi:class 3 adenylate cyclase